MYSGTKIQKEDKVKQKESKAKDRQGVDKVLH
jgi:hypothetical protein